MAAQPDGEGDSGVYPTQIELIQRDPRITPNLPTQRGPAPAPEHDVYGDWYFTGAKLVVLGAFE